MIWKLYLDDQANDPQYPERKAPNGFLVAKSVKQAKALVVEHGLPILMDLDHDLGYSNPDCIEDALDFLEWLERYSYEMSQEEYWPDRIEYWPPDYVIHSRNPVGVERINSFMQSWMKAAKSL